LKARSLDKRVVNLLPLVLWWSATVAIAAHSYFISDAPNPLRTGTSAYGHNGDGAFWFWLAFFGAELVAAVSVLLPFRRPIKTVRIFIGCGLAVPWAVVLALVSMHQGPVYFWHFVWVAGVALVLAGLSLWRLIA
jgi:hypothetical protein